MFFLGFQCLASCCRQGEEELSESQKAEREALQKEAEDSWHGVNPSKWHLFFGGNFEVRPKNERVRLRSFSETIINILVSFDRIFADGADLWGKQLHKVP